MFHPNRLGWRRLYLPTCFFEFSDSPISEQWSRVKSKIPLIIYLKIKNYILIYTIDHI